MSNVTASSHMVEKYLEMVEDSKPSRSPIPSEALEVKLKLTFESNRDLVDKLKNLLRQAYTCWDYTSEQARGSQLIKNQDKDKR